MGWTVLAHPGFAPEMRRDLPDDARFELQAHVRLLSIHGPTLTRPHADTLKGSRHANMKELRFRTERGVWRVAYAFDPNRRAILLCAADKQGLRGPKEKRFYARLIAKADARFDDYAP